MTKTTTTGLPFELSGEAVITILGALASRKAAERNNLALGPGSQLIVDHVERAEVEILQQVPEATKCQLGIFVDRRSRLSA